MIYMIHGILKFVDKNLYSLTYWTLKI